MVLDELSDEELMVMYQNGAENAFQVLYSRHSSKIYGFLKKRILQLEKVTDIYQDVFVKIHKSKHLYNKSLPVLPWLFTITKSVMIDELRKEKKHKSADSSDFEKIPATSPRASPLDEITLRFEELPSLQKNVLQMRYVDDKTFEEIAESLKMNPTNVRKIVSRGIKRLKELINHGEDL